MGRIEDALQKLARSRHAAASGGAPQRIARLADSDSTQPHTYGGRAIRVDGDALRRHGLLAPDAEVHRLAEEYRVIKRPLLANADPRKDPPTALGNLIMVASALAGEGKSFTCVNLSLSIAKEKDWSVVLVDTDCNKPQLTQLFSAETEPGLLDLLKDPGRTFESVVMPTDVPGVSLLPLGAQDRQASELLASRRMRDLCLDVSARDRQRILIFDSSPLLLTTEAPVLASQVGQVVVVVRANHTQQQAVLAALDMLDPSKAIGCVLNQQASSSLLDGYGYYGSYGHAPTDAGKTGSNSGPGERNSATP